MPGAWRLVLLLLHNLRQEAVYLRLVLVAPNSGTDLGRLAWAARSDQCRMQGRSADAPERRGGTLGVRVRSGVRDLAARVVEVHPVATKGLWWQVTLQLVHTGVDAFAVRRWGCSSWQACACTRVVPTGGAHGLEGGTLRARDNTVRCTRRCPRDHRGIIWGLQWRTVSVHQRLRMRRRRVCRVFREPMARVPGANGSAHRG